MAQVEVAKKRAALDVRNSKRQAKGEKPFEARQRGKATSVAVPDVADEAVGTCHHHHTSL